MRIILVILAVCVSWPVSAQADDQHKLGVRVTRYSQRILCMENISSGYSFGATFPVIDRDMRASPQVTYAFALAEPIEREMLAGRDGRVKIFLDRQLEVTSPASSNEFERLIRVCALGRLTMFAVRNGDPIAPQLKSRFSSELTRAPNTELLGAVAGQLVTLSAQAGEYDLAREIADLYTQPRWRARQPFSPLFYQNAAEGLRLSSQTDLTSRLIREMPIRDSDNYFAPIWGISNTYQMLKDLRRGSAERARLLNSQWFQDANMKTIFMRDPELAAEVALYVLSESDTAPSTQQVMLKAVRLSLLYMEQRLPDRTYAALGGLTRMPSTVPPEIRSELLSKYRSSLNFLKSNRELGAALLTSPQTLKISMQGFTDPRGRFLEAGDFETAHFLAEAERFEPLTAFLASRGLAEGQPGEKRNIAAIHDVLTGNPPREEVYWGRLLDASPAKFASFPTGPAFHKSVGNDAVKPRSATREASALVDHAQAIVGSRTPIPRIEQVAASLKPDEAAISIIVSENHSGMLLLTREGMTHLKISANSATLESLGHRIIRSLENPSSPFDYQALTQLSHLVLIPALKQLENKKQIYWVADGSLGSVPPQVLLSSVAGPARRHLIQDRAVSVLPSLSALYWSRRLKPAPRSDEFLGIGNPQLSGSYDGSLGLSTTLPPLAEAKDLVKRFGALPGSGEHLDLLAAQFPQSRMLTLSDATESAIAAHAGHYGVVAFATHGINAGDTGYIAEAGLILTPDPKTDGFFRSSEVANGRLSASVVLLTACSSIKGDGMRVNGPLGGLARAFLANGSGSVVGTNWNVPDKPSYAFSQRLIANLAKGDTIGQAHRQSVIAAIGENSDPRHWAAFSLAGDGQTTTH